MAPTDAEFPEAGFRDAGFRARPNPKRLKSSLFRGLERDLWLMDPPCWNEPKI